MAIMGAAMAVSLVVCACGASAVGMTLNPFGQPDRQGKSYRGEFFVDRFKPGRCRWELVEVRYAVEDNAGEGFRLFRYDSIADRRTSDTVDFLCTRVPAGYVSPDPRSKLREVACQSARPEQLDRHRLLKRAAVAG
jgi:hypothetical protein